MIRVSKIVFIIILVGLGLSTFVKSANLIIKLPFIKEEKFTVVQGYNTLPTHINNEIYALDFSKEGCEAYGKDIVSAIEGNIILVQQVGYNGGFGTQLMIQNENGLVSRYAHLIQNSVFVNIGENVVLGQYLGKVGRTGLVSGTACPEYPGTHLHFSMYQKQADGSLVAYKPEPISRYGDGGNKGPILAGNYYVSDNELYEEHHYAAVPIEERKSFFAQVVEVASIFLNNLVGRNDNQDLKLATEIKLKDKTVVANQLSKANQVEKTAYQNAVVLADNQDEDAAERLANSKKISNNQLPISNLASVAGTAVISSAIGLSSAGQGEATVMQCKYGNGGAATHQKLFINEVAWMGGPVSANDEWLELKNISGSELDVSGWQILDKDEQIKITFSNGKKVPAGGFLLLERTDDNSLPGIAADLIYSGALSNTDEGLRLFDNNCVLVDEVSASPDWPAGESASRKTMERVSDLSWHNYSGNGENGIFGTPKKENSPAVVSEGSSNNNFSVSTPPAAQNILISEIQTTGGTGQADNEFIELYNPNDSVIDLSVLPLNLHIRNSAGTDSHKLLTFINKAIPARGYFLIGPASGYLGTAALDATYSTSSGNKLVNNGGVYISKSATVDMDVLDKVGWGIQPAGGYETAAFPENPIVNQSISRQSANDTGNNSSDFIKSKPTPKNSSVSGGFLNPEAWVVSEQLVNHIVISEIYPDRTGANLDFVELYNPNATSTGDLDISGWSLQVLSANATSTDKIAKKNFVTGNKISGRGFFLIGIDNYSGGDMTWSSGSLNSTDGATIFLVSGTTTISNISDSRIVDRVSYGGGSAADFAEGVAVAMPAAGQSLERMAFRNDFCVSAQNSGEFFGNGCDTNNNFSDFELRATPTPQSLVNFIEPRSAPTAIQNFTADYSTSTLSVSLNWAESTDYRGATSSIKYEIKYATSSPDNLKNLTELIATTTYNFKINEVGTSYCFFISAKDKEGLGSDISSTTLAVPSFLTDVFIYPDPRIASTTALELRYNSYPFIPNIYSGGFRVLIFYKNQDAPTLPYFYSDLQYGTTPDGVYPKQYGEWGNSIDAAWKLRYSSCSFSPVSDRGTALILPDSAAFCSNGFGGIRNSAFDFSKLEDLNLIIGLASNQLAPVDGDYATVAFYSYTSYNAQTLVAVDRKRYYFQKETPVHRIPQLNGKLELYFNKENSRLEVKWPKATDSDLLDYLITYDISYDGGINWQSTGTQNKTSKVVIPGNSFSILVRAKDDFGNYSDPPLAVSWSYPETVFSISQTQANSWSASFGAKNPNCPWCPGTASLQSIQPAEDFQFNVLVLRLWKEFGDGADMQISVYSDLNNSPNFNSLIASSSIKGVMDPDKNSDIAFSFDAPITFTGGNKYWLVLGVEYGGSNAGFFRSQWHNAINTGIDLYDNGQAGSGNAGICTSSYCSAVYIPYTNATADWYVKIGFAEY